MTTPEDPAESTPETQTSPAEAGATGASEAAPNKASPTKASPQRRKRLLLAVAAGIGLPTLVAIGSVIGSRSRPHAAPSGSMADGTAAGARVSECDEYVTTVQSCMKTMPPSMRATMAASMEKIQESWRTAKSTPDGTATLAAGCKAALEKLGKNRYCRAATALGAARSGQP